MKKKSMLAKVREIYAANAAVTPKEIISTLKCKPKAAYATLYLVRKEAKGKVNSVPPKRGRPSKKVTEPNVKELHDVVFSRLVDNMTEPKNSLAVRKKARALLERYELGQADPINNPPHYTDGGIDTITYIEAKRLGYHLGNVVKYVSRAGKKGTNAGLEDLKKAQWYLSRAIEKNEFSPVSR